MSHKVRTVTRKARKYKVAASPDAGLGGATCRMGHIAPEQGGRPFTCGQIVGWGRNPAGDCSTILSGPLALSRSK